MNQPDEHRLEIQIEEALVEYMSACDSGNVPNRDSFLAKQPAELREQLLELLSTADWIEQLAGPTISQAVADASSPEEVSALLDETLPQVLGQPNGEHGTLPQDFGRSPPPRGATRTATSQARRGASLSLPVLPCEFGDYVLERVLGRGGMGVVYFGRQRHLDRPVAIKMIRSGALASAEEVQRFYAEARSAAKLDHPNIVTVYQCGECDGHHYFSMDYVAGTDLAKMTANKPLNGKVAARYVRDVAKAIQYAHDRGILHRDLKPANVLVDEHDSVQITDFGLAKLMGHDTGLTAEGAALGTPSYMSPEQAAGKVEEHHQATDIYSLGAILFTLVTGRPPFKAAGVVQTIMQVIHRPAPMAKSVEKSVDEDLETIIDVCLQKSPEKRYQSAAALALELDRYLAGVPIQARPTSHLRRSWYWLLGVPIFGAVLDHRVAEPTDAHRWVQRVLISAGILLACAWLLMLIPSSVWFHNRMPRNVRIAAGLSGGNYDEIATELGAALARATNCQTDVLATAGSRDNLELLLDRRADLALLQADSIGSNSIALIAPLYYEAVHIIVRTDSAVESIADLRGKQISIGPEKAGSRDVAKLLLEHVGLSLADVKIIDVHWRELGERQDLDAAIVVSKLGAREVVQLLGSGLFRLLAIPNAIDFALLEPSFHPLVVSSSVYPRCHIDSSGIPSVATTAYLATRAEIPDVLVEHVLDELYQPQMVERTGILPLSRAAHWQGIAWHPAAHEFFRRATLSP